MRSEAELSWDRNNYFLVVASVLLLALSQFHGLTLVQWLVIIVGIVVSATWLVAHHRSANYLGYWKTETGKLERTLGHSIVYSKDVEGMETRKILYVVPFAFLALWVLLGIMLWASWLKI